MPVGEAVGDAPVAELDEPQVGEAIDQFGALVRGVVVFLAPVQRGCDGTPEAGGRGGVRQGG